MILVSLVLFAQWLPTGYPAGYGEGPSQEFLQKGRMVDQVYTALGGVFCAPQHDSKRSQDRLILRDFRDVPSTNHVLAEGPRNTFLNPVAVADTGTVGCGWMDPDLQTLHIVSLDSSIDSIRTVSIPFPDTLRMFRIHPLTPDRWIVTVLSGNAVYTLMYDPLTHKIVREPEEESRVHLQGIRFLGFSRTPRNEPVIFGYDSLTQSLGFSLYDADSGYFLPFTPDPAVPSGHNVDEADFLWLSPNQRLWAVSLKDPVHPLAETLRVFCADPAQGNCIHVYMEGVPVHHPRWAMDPATVVLLWAQATDTLEDGGYRWAMRLSWGGYSPFGVPIVFPDTLASLWMPVPARWMFFGLHASALTFVAGRDGTGRERDGWWLNRQGVSIPTRYERMIVDIPLAIKENRREGAQTLRVQVLPGRRVKVQTDRPLTVTDLLGRPVPIRQKGPVLHFPQAGVYRLHGKTGTAVVVIP